MSSDMKGGDVREAEHRFWTAMQQKDGATAGRMTVDGCIVVGAQGVSTITSAQMTQMTGDAKWELQEFAFDESKLQVRFLSEDTVIVAYPVHERLVVEGRTLELDANDASVWVRQNGEWRCALHTESLAGDPFGRDRNA